MRMPECRNVLREVAHIINKLVNKLTVLESTD